MAEQTFEKDLGKVVGNDGITPHIGANGNWYLGDTDSGVPATGPKGDKGDPGASSFYRHSLAFNCNGRGIAYYEITDKSSAEITASNLATRLGRSSGGAICASGVVNRNSVMYIVSHITFGADGTLNAHGVKLDGSVTDSLSIMDYSETTGVTVTDTPTEV